MYIFWWQEDIVDDKNPKMFSQSKDVVEQVREIIESQVSETENCWTRFYF